jgi:predicted O-linked N-acetylglucosamine transferase (SPINDLY family)
MSENAHVVQPSSIAFLGRRFVNRPIQADDLHKLALAACQQGRLAEGIAYARQALAIDFGRARTHLLLGMALARSGQLDDALASFDRAIAIAPDLADAHGSRADVLVELGRPAEAIESYDRALEITPQSLESWCNRAATLVDLGRYEDALASYDQVVTIEPQLAEAHFSRGNVLFSLERYRDAIAAFDTALALKPDDPVTLSNKANALCKLGRHDDAVTCFDKVLAITPRYAETHAETHAGVHAGALMGRGIALIELGNWEESLRAFDMLLSIAPDSVDALNNRGFVLNALARREEAIASYERALAIDPEHAEALVNRGAALADLGRNEAAIGSYDRALTVAPHHVGALCNRAKALNALCRYEEALSSLERALAVRPDHAEAIFTRGNTFFMLQRFDAAIDCFEQVRAIKPDHPHAEAALVNCCLSTCDWDRLARLEPRLNDGIAAGRIIVSPHILLQLSIDAANALACTRRFVAHEIPIGPRLPPIRKGAHSDRIRLAYLSGDFRRHPVAYLIAGLLERHDRSRFEVIGVSFGPDDRSEIRARIERAVDQFHDVRSRSDSEVATLMRDLGVDIVVDLTGHTQMSRPSILSHRPAPIQVSYLGLLGTMGADFIDYVIADEIVLPFDRQPFFSEKIVHLPDCFMVGDDRVASTASTLPVPDRSKEGLPTEGFVFSSFNASYKFREPIFAAWMNLLRSVDGSVLWLLASNQQSVANLRKEAQQRGVDPGRLIFAARTGLAEHVSRQQLADIFLDTVPYNAGATAMAVLQAGVPILTVMGDQWVGRMAASMLSAIGCPDLVTSSIAHYEALARKLATEPALMASLRARLARNRLTHPLFNTDRFRRHIEAAYRTMRERSRRGQAPASFRVDPIGAR